MAVVDRGTKRRCNACGAPFYDLNKDPVVCPKCQSPYTAAARVPVRALRGRMQDLRPIAAEESPSFEEEEVPEHVDEDEDGLPPENGDQDHHEDDELRD